MPVSEPSSGNHPLYGQSVSDREREELRILVAVRDGRLTENEHGRYKIRDEIAPAFKVRKSLENRGMIRWCARFQRRIPNEPYKLTPRGEKRMDTITKRLVAEREAA